MKIDKELSLYKCGLKETILKEIDINKIPIPELIKKICQDERVPYKTQQYIYYCSRKYYAHTFKSIREQNKLGLKWNWFNTGINLYDCLNIVESDYITKSHHIRYSQWVNKCCNCDHLLYCNDLSHASYCVFNQPVTQKRFSELKQLTLTELKIQPEFNKTIYKTLTHIHKLLAKGKI